MIDILFGLLSRVYMVSPKCDDEESPKESSSTSTIISEPQVTSINEEKGQNHQVSVPLEQAVRPHVIGGQTSCNREAESMCVMGESQDSSHTSSPLVASKPQDEVNLCLMSKKKRIKAKKCKSQKIEQSSSLAKELELLKLSYASFVCKYESLENDYTCATQSLSCVALYEKSNEMPVAQLEKITNEHMSLQAVHKELECSHEKLVESYATLDIALKVLLSSIKSYQPLSYTCTCSLGNISISCSYSCC